MPAAAIIAMSILGGAVGRKWYLRFWLLLPALLVAGIVALNFGFHRFLAREKQALFAALIFPHHVLYYLYSGLGFAAGAVRHWRKRFESKPTEYSPSRASADRSN